MAAGTKVKTVLILPLLCSARSHSLTQLWIIHTHSHSWKEANARQDKLSLLDEATIYKTFLRRKHSPVAVVVHPVLYEAAPPAPQHTVLMNETTVLHVIRSSSLTFRDHSHDLPGTFHHFPPHRERVWIMKVSALLQLWPTWWTQFPLSFPISHVAAGQPCCQVLSEGYHFSDNDTNPWIHFLQHHPCMEDTRRKQMRISLQWIWRLQWS